MQYRNDRNGNPLSLLGFGCMRFERAGGPGGGRIDYPKAEAQIMRAIDLGVNYFDTAYIYPGSEELLGEVLESNHARDRVNIATKLPQYLIRSSAAIERYFQEELRRLRTDHVDYYLMHMLTDVVAWQKLERLGIREWIEHKKASGEIRNIGFSFHGNTQMFLKVLDAYDWDFCQIQYNYMDENSQAGRTGLLAAAERGIPVIIMEPLRGGKLVNLLPREARDLIARDAHGWSPAELALRWLYSQPQVTCVLSGMNSIPMVEENCRVASEAAVGCVTDADLRLIDRVKEIVNERMRIGCTGCGYCMPCPKGVDIPSAFRCWNEMYTEGKAVGRKEYWQVVSLRKEPAFATQCVRCGKCEAHCPQHLPIRDALPQADRDLRPPHYRVAGAIARRFALG
ncbi:MAG: aldo/keto reductase [Olsenella sp.]|nr:aldo/keto reductase [Olsenella sp.]MCI1288838.1 aldo/keto reductase [Olsenella sp.]